MDNRENRSEIVEWSGTVLRCLLRCMPWDAWQRADVNDIMKSGIARDRGSRMTRPPALMLSCAMSRAWCGREVVPRRSDRKFWMMKLVVEVRGDDQV